MVQVFKLINIKDPGGNYELHIFCKLDNKTFSLLNDESNIFLHGRVTHDEIIKELQKSYIWLYIPQTCRETYCISALEAQCAKCLCFVNNIGALGDVVGERGYVFNVDDSNEHRAEIILEKIKDDDYINKKYKLMEEWVVNQTWKKRSEQWVDLFKSNGCSIVPSKNILKTINNEFYFYKDMDIDGFDSESVNNLNDVIERFKNPDVIGFNTGYYIKSKERNKKDSIKFIQRLNYSFSSESPLEDGIYIKKSYIHSISKKREFDYKTFCINLERRPDRLKTFHDEMKDQDLKYEIFPACDGAMLKEAQLNNSEPLGYPKLNDIEQMFLGNDFNYRCGVLGCALSHIKLWKQLVNDSIDYYLIFEDDVKLVPNFRTRLQNVINTFSGDINGIDIIYLGYTRGKKQIHESPLISIKSGEYWGTFSYLITKQGANKILNFIKENSINRAIDGFLVDLTTTNYINVRSIEPLLSSSRVYNVREGIKDNSDTDIQNDFTRLLYNNNKKFSTDKLRILKNKVPVIPNNKEKHLITETRNIYLYWIGKDYKLISILRNLIYLHSTNGIGYNIILITDKNVNDYIKNIPDYFNKLCPAHQADFVRVNVICDYGGIWLDSDTLVVDTMDTLFDIIEKKSGFFIRENNEILWNGIFGSKPNTPLMIKWKTEMINILDKTQGKIGWADIGCDLLQSIYNENPSLYNDCTIFDGLDNLYPVNWNNCKTEFIDKPYDNYRQIVRKYQPLVVLVNIVYKSLENKTEKEILEGTMPINYFINKSFENMKIT